MQIFLFLVIIKNLYHFSKLNIKYVTSFHIFENSYLFNNV
jgi:hypothetical protein